MKRWVSLISILFFIQALTSHAQTKLKPDLVVQTNHGGFIESVAFSPNGELLATGGIDGTIKIWNLESNRQILTISAHPGIKIDSDKELPHWTQSKDISVNLFERYDGFGRANCVHSLNFSHDSKLLVSGSSDRTVKIWNLNKIDDLKQGKAEKVFNTQIRIWFVEFNNDGSKILSIGEDNSHKYWDVIDEDEITDNPLLLKAFQLPWQNPDRTMSVEYSERQESIKLSDTATGLTKILGGHEAGVRRAIFSPDGKFLASCGWDRTVRLWDLTREAQPIVLGGHDSFVSSLAFSKDSKTLASVGGDLTIKLWDVKNLKISKTLSGYGKIVTPYYFALNNKILISSSENRAFIWDLEKGIKYHDFEIHTGRVDNAAFNEAKRILATSAETAYPFQAIIVGIASGISREKERRLRDGTILTPDNFVKIKSPDALGAYDKSFVSDNSISLWNYETNEGKILKGHKEYINSLVFSYDGNILASGDRNGIIWLWDLNNTNNQASVTAYKDDEVFALAFSHGGNRLASLNRKGNLRFWKITNDKELRLTPDSVETKVNLRFTFWLGFSLEDEALIVFGKDDNNNLSNALYETKSGTLINDGTNKSNPKFQSSELQRAVSEITKVALTGDQRFQVRSDKIGRLALYDKQELLAWLISFSEENWAVVTPEGRFDTNILENSVGLNWTFPDDPIEPLPFEIFMRPYYEPRLLPRLLANDDFREVPALGDLNRVQPRVTITDVRKDGAGTATVTVEVEGVQHTYQREKNSVVESGAKDLRLFRDGQLVGYRDGDLLDREQRATSACEPVAGSAKKCRTIFEHIRLPRQEDVKDVEFSAYAFNTSDVKSETFRFPFKFSPELPVGKGRAYLITVGVSNYENPDWNLDFAANDAHLIDDTLPAQLRATGDYDDVIGVMLTSEERVVNGQRELIKSATKENFRRVLRLLAGEKLTEAEIKEIPNAQKIKKATPEDVVMIFYSSHGYRDQERFYLFPYDTGRGQGRDPEAVVPHSISSDDLYGWLRDIDAGDMVLVIDACHAAAVTGKEFKPGPMGSSGMGQLAYDKGMRILAATQPDTTAPEVGNINRKRKIQHGLLTYALVQDGLIDRQADSNGDRLILLSEWLQFGVTDVPKLYEKAVESQTEGAPPMTVPGIIGGTTQVRFISKGDGDTSTQQPALFDFTDKLKRKRQLVVSKY